MMVTGKNLNITHPEKVKVCQQNVEDAKLLSSFSLGSEKCYQEDI